MTRTLIVLSLLFAACEADPAADDLDAIDTGLDTAGKADSLWLPTDAGALQLLYAQTRNLEQRTSGYHVYTFDGRAGWQVTMVEKSADFRTYLRVYAPSGHRVSRSGVANTDGAWESTLHLTLPETGIYYVLATSWDNMHGYSYARSEGEYTLSADAQLTCAGFAALTCPDYLRCMGVASNPDAGGTCQRQDACQQPTDCAGLIHPECAIGPNGGWHCEGAGRSADGHDTYGQCHYYCGNRS